MPMVLELIPEEFKKSFDFSVCTGPFGRFKGFPAWGGQWWVIDRDRNAFIFPTGGGSGDWQKVSVERWYGVWFDGSVGTFHGKQVVKKLGAGTEVNWIDKNPIVKTASSDRGSMSSFVKDALKVARWNGSNNGNVSFTTDLK